MFLDIHSNKIGASGTYGVDLGGTACTLAGGDAGDEGAVLELDELVPDDVFGVVLDVPELTVELESDAGTFCG